MALLQRKSVRKVRKTEAKVKSIDHRFIGDEPVTVTPESYSRALSWYSYTYDVDKAREFLLEYLKSTSTSKTEFAHIRRCPKERIVTTACWQARMMSNGNKLSERSQSYFNEKYAEMVAYGKGVKEEVKTGVAAVAKPSIQERTALKNQYLYNVCDNEIFEHQKTVYDWLQKHEVTPGAASYIQAKIQPLFEEVMSDDPDVKEGFGKNLKKERTYWQSVMDDLDRYVGNKKAVKVRKPKAKKVKAAIDVVKKLKFQKEEPSLKIVSVNPAEIIGAQQLWTYNSKYKKLTVFNAVGPAGFTVKGTTLLGFDEKTSVTKRLRKPEKSISELLVAGKVTLRKFMDTLTTTASVPNGRINNETILLKVVK